MYVFDGTFQIWDATPSHGFLLIRGLRSQAHKVYNIDFIFGNVEYISCPSILKDITIYQADEEDAATIIAKLPPASVHEKVFIIESQGLRHFIVAGSLSVERNNYRFRLSGIRRALPREAEEPPEPVEIEELTEQTATL